MDYPTCLRLIFALALFSSAVVADDNSDISERFRLKVAPFLKSYCVDCHGTDLQEAKLDLSGFDSAKSVAVSHGTWEIVLERLMADEMPPSDAADQPSSKERGAVIQWIQQFRQAEAERNAGDPGPVLVRRLSNAEFNNTIRDLSGFDIRPTDTFPVDPANEAGFDNSGESLTMSPALLTKYLEASRYVVEHLVLKPDSLAFAPHPVMTDTDRDKYCVKRIVEFYERQPVDLADYFFAAWQYRNRKHPGDESIALTKIAVANGISSKYLTTIWQVLTDNNDAVGPIQTLRDQWRLLPAESTDEEAVRAACHQISDCIGTLRTKLKPSVEDLSVDELHKGAQPLVLWRNRRYAANRRKLNRDVLTVRENEPDDVPKTVIATADDSLTVSADATARALQEAAFERFCSVFPDAFFISERGRDYVDDSGKQDGERGRLLSAGFHSMMGYFRDDQPLYELILSTAEQQELDSLWHELNFVASAPMRQYVGFLWFERTDSRYMRDPQFDFARPENRESQSEEMIEKLSELYIQKAKKNGGNDTAIKAIDEFFDQINEQIRYVEETRSSAEPIHVAAVREFAARAFRRPLSNEENEGLAEFYNSLRHNEGLSHEQAIQDSVVAILMSPHFCYRVDLHATIPDPRPLNDFELASRLSYFLWASTPDEELLHIADAGQLRQPEVLIDQTRRMLQDDRIRGLATEFAGNWLDFRRFQQHNSVDRDRFPAFTDELRSAMFEEPLRFFEDVVRNDRSVLEFLYASHTFVNADLARHYDIPLPDNHADTWKRIDNADEYNRGGLLPMSVFLTMNAPGLRTSPVKRGYWVVRRLLGERIPPPPPNVPELPEDESRTGELSLAEALARHREHKSCSGCHDRFDAIGIAFESFGPVGEKRSLDLGGRPVVIGAEFPDNRERSGMEGLRDYLRAQRQQDFLENLSRKLLSYSLGRSLILSDDLLVAEIQNRLHENEHRFGSLIECIVTSPQFLNKRGKAPSNPDE